MPDASEAFLSILCRAGFHTCRLNSSPKDSADRDIRPTNSVRQCSVLPNVPLVAAKAKLSPSIRLSMRSLHAGCQRSFPKHTLYAAYRSMPIRSMPTEVEPNMPSSQILSRPSRYTYVPVPIRSEFSPHKTFPGCNQKGFSIHRHTPKHLLLEMGMIARCSLPRLPAHILILENRIRTADAFCVLSAGRHV